MDFGLSDEQLPLRYAVWRFARTELAQKAARLLIWRAAANSDQGLPSILDSSSAKSFANHVARCVTGKAVNLMGGYGYSGRNPMERRIHDAWGWGIAGRAIDLQQVNIASTMIGRRFDQRR
ncbi:acyl-CoA dehydrogenase family protein [Blastomonas fulva]|uniref:acyl-CoA dehydrogenase family protein n=1 Tax=Blastomonas fulva TaxID=1550728 RepID=UPI003F71349B